MDKDGVSSSKPILGVLVLIALAAIIGAAVYFFGGGSGADDGSQKTPEPTAMGSVKDDVVNWETYKNDEYDFEVKHPKGLLITEKWDETAPRSYSIEFGDSFYGQTAKVNIYKNYQKLSLEDWLLQVKEKRQEGVPIQWIKFHGKDAISLSGAVYIAIADYIYSISPFIDQSEGENTIPGQIVYSFKFLEQPALNPGSVQRFLCASPEAERISSDIRRTRFISPDLQRCAFVFEDAAKADYVVLDSTKGSEYDFVKGFGFSPDSRHFAYVARKDVVRYSDDQKKYPIERVVKGFVVYDGIEGAQYDFLINNVYFSPDGKSFAYDARKDKGENQSIMVLNNAESKKYNWVGDGVFSPDSKHFAYSAIGDMKNFIVLDGQEGQRYEKVEGLVFSPSSQHFIYKAKIGNNSFIVLDGQEKKDVHEFPVFSATNDHLAFIIEKDSKKTIVLDGVLGESHNNIQNLTFSASGERFAYIATDEYKQSVVHLDGKAGKKYEKIKDLVFSADGKRFSYTVEEKGKQFAVIDGEEGKKYDEVFSVTFSPDDTRIAYGAREGNRFFAVLDGVEDEKFDGNYYQDPHAYYYLSSVERFTFSPDSKKFAYRVNMKDRGPAGDKFIVLYDQGKKNILFDSFSGTFFFSSNSKYFAYKVTKGYKTFILDSDREGTLYKTAFDLVFSDDSKYLYYDIETVLGEVYYFTEPLN